MKILSLCFAVIMLVLAPVKTLAQETTGRTTPRSTCMAVAENIARILPASASLTFARALQPHEVRITYAAHSTYRIEDATGLVIATDYNGFAGLGPLPDVVTMNHAHSSHFTHFPDPGIPHVLPGWGEDGKPANHHLQIGEVIVRNVTTHIQNRYAGYEENGNSIFIFETGGLCIGHLGHLHHVLTDAHYAQIGRIDILMVPVDGGLTMNLEGMTQVVKRLNASMVLPMHWFGTWSLGRFLEEMKGAFPLDVRNGSTLEVSLNTLPDVPTIIVLQPQQVRDGYLD